MLPSLSRLLVALVSLGLVLPPGWCCTALPAGGEVPVPTRRSCCHGHTKTPAGRPPAHPCQQTPGKGLRCACPDRDSATASRTKSFPVQPTVAFDALPTPGVRFLRESGDRAPGRPCVSFLSPQLLHCVWLC